MNSFGKLPHRPFRHVPMHVIYRLKDSIPRQVLRHLQEDYAAHAASVAYEGDSAEATRRQVYEVLIEDALHETSNGPYHLSDPRIADIVLSSWQWLAANRGIQVHAVCVMGNHVHVLVSSQNGCVVPAGKIMRDHKSHTGLAANRLLGLGGEPFWEVSYFDRDVRAGTFNTVMWYILNNPVAAGLVDHWEAWPHTYLYPDYDMLFRRFTETAFRERLRLALATPVEEEGMP